LKRERNVFASVEVGSIQPWIAAVTLAAALQIRGITLKTTRSSGKLNLDAYLQNSPDPR
jgi:hypothetical protein